MKAWLGLGLPPPAPHECSAALGLAELARRRGNARRQEVPSGQHPAARGAGLVPLPMPGSGCGRQEQAGSSPTGSSSPASFRGCATTTTTVLRLVIILDTAAIDLITGLWSRVAPGIAMALLVPPRSLLLPRGLLIIAIRDGERRESSPSAGYPARAAARLDSTAGSDLFAPWWHCSLGDTRGTRAACDRSMPTASLLSTARCIHGRRWSARRRATATTRLRRGRPLGCLCNTSSWGPIFALRALLKTIRFQ